MTIPCPVIPDRKSQFDDNGFPVCVFVPAGCHAESVYLYRPGGLPPIDIGNKYCDTRFTILYKLGFGWSSTVWLAFDERTGQHVALKMMSASHSTSTMQMKVQELFCRYETPTGTPCILEVLDSFNFESPNGHHLCFVFEWAGPNLEQLLSGRKIRPDSARRMSKDIASAIRFLHSNEAAFGDLSTSNILLRLKGLSWDSTSTFVERLQSNIYACPLETYEGREAWARHGPKKQYNGIQAGDFEASMLTPQVVLTDLNEAVILNEASIGETSEDESAVRMRIAAPEYIFGINKRHTKASDIWSLACCFFEIRTSERLIKSDDAPDIGSEMIQLIGTLPQTWVNSVQPSSEHSGHELLSKLKPLPSEDDRRLEKRIRSIGEWHPWIMMTWEERRQYYINFLGMDFASDPKHHHELEDHPAPPARLSSEEAKDFNDLLSKMLRYIPEERISIEEVLAHSWLNTNYTDLDAPSSRWLSYYKDFKHMRLQTSADSFSELESDIEYEPENALQPLSESCPADLTTDAPGTKAMGFPSQSDNDSVDDLGDETTRSDKEEDGSGASSPSSNPNENGIDERWQIFSIFEEEPHGGSFLLGTTSSKASSSPPSVFSIEDAQMVGSGFLNEELPNSDSDTPKSNEGSPSKAEGSARARSKSPSSRGSVKRTTKQETEARASAMLIVAVLGLCLGISIGSGVRRVWAALSG